MLKRPTRPSPSTPSSTPFAIFTPGAWSAPKPPALSHDGNEPPRGKQRRFWLSGEASALGSRALAEIRPRSDHPRVFASRPWALALLILTARSLVTTSGHALEPTVPADPISFKPAQPQGLKRATAPHRVSLTFSPFHLGYPLLFISNELRVTRKLGVALETGLGGYRGGTVGQLGLRAVGYPVGSFDGGLQLGLFLRGTRLHLPDADAVNFDEVGSAHRAMAPIYNDVEFARANGRDAVFGGVLIGGKLVVDGGEGESVRGFTVQGGFLLGYHHLTGEARHGPSPDATRTRSGFLPMLYGDIGWSL